MKGVFVDLNKLIRQLTQDQQSRVKHEDPWSIMIFNRSDKEYTHKNLKSENSSFMWFQLLIEVLLGMETHFETKNELIDICKNQYKNNTKFLAIIDEFQKFYNGTNAIWWYTRESCFYYLLNKALRIQNIDILFIFRFFIKDLFNELTREHRKLKQSSSNEQFNRVFRGQVISTDELSRMKKSIGEFISINSFFSASKNRKYAIDFTKQAQSSKDVQQILYDIQIDVHLSTKPFADVTHLSYYKTEKEIIFMLGTIFRITNVVYSDKYSIWVACISLCSDNDHDLRDLFAYQKEKISRSSGNIASLGDILLRMGDFDKAKQYYNRILNELATNERSVANCYFGLGNVAIEQDNHQQALVYHLKALDIRRKFLKDDHRNIASSCNQIGDVYQRLNQYDKALEYTQIGLQIRLKYLGNNDVDSAQSYRQLGVIYYRLEKHDLALSNCRKAHEIYTKVLPKNHPDLAENLGYMGYIYEAIGQYDLALQYLGESLMIVKKSLPEYHADIGVILEAIGSVFSHKHNYISALDYFNQSLDIFHKSLQPTHKFTQGVQQRIQQAKQLLLQSSQQKN